MFVLVSLPESIPPTLLTYNYYYKPDQKTMGMENFTVLKILGEGAFASVHKVRQSKSTERGANHPAGGGSLKLEMY